MSVFKLINKNVLSFVSARSYVLDQAKSRLNLMAVFFLLGFVLIAFRAFDLSIIRGPGFAELHQARLGLDKGEAPVRGDILDRHGIVLATSVETASLYADPKMIADPDEVASALQKIWPDINVAKKLVGGGRFVWVRRHMTPKEQSQVLALGYPGLRFKDEWKRLYPHGSMAAHIIGCSTTDSQGVCGIERSAQDILSKGQDVSVSIDIRVQHLLEKYLLEAMEKHSAIGAAGAVMDIRTGEMLAATSLPDFDPNDLSAAAPASLFNRLTQGVYELGSTFKVFSTAAYLEMVGSDFDQEFDVQQPLRVGRFAINDYHAEERVLTLPEVFIHSSNIGSAMMAQEIGTSELKNFYRDLGLFDPLDIHIKERATPLLPNPWREASTLTASYGHGLAVTPLHVVQASASIINQGMLTSPQFLRVEQAQETRLQVVSRDTSSKVNALLRLAVSHGTGKNANIHGFLVGGKTGTAEKIGETGYDSNKLISSFVGAFPMNSPKYIVFIMLDEPKSTADTYGYATGGWVAAPVAKKIIARLSSLYGIPPQDEHAAHQSLTQPLLKYIRNPETSQTLQSGQANIASY